MGNIVCPTRAKKAEAQTTNEDKGATATGYASPGKGADGYAAPDGYALPGKDADTTEKRKEDFDKEVLPDNSGQNAAPPVPKLRRALSGNQKPSKKFDEQKALAELARSNPDKYVKYLMTHLDDLNGKDIDSTVESIFKEFDEDGNGVLTGNEYDKCVQKLAEHMFGEYEEHGEKLFEYLSREWGMSEEEIDPIRSEYKEKGTIETCKNKVIELVDVDGDGEITLQEAMDGFHKVVDAIE